MIVLKHNGAIYIAKCRWTMRDPEAVRNCVPDVENINMWHPKKKKNRIIAVGDSGRFADTIRYENVFPSALDQKHLFFESYDKIHSIAERFGLCNEDRLPERVVFAEDDKAYVLYDDGSNMEVENIYSDDCNDEVTVALYDILGVSDPYEFFREAYRSLEIVRRYVMFPVVVMNTKNNKIEVLSR